MCTEKLNLEVGKLYIDNVGRTVKPVFVSNSKETLSPVLCVVSPDYEGGSEHERWFTSNGKAAAVRARPLHADRCAEQGSP